MLNKIFNATMDYIAIAIFAIFISIPVFIAYAIIIGLISIPIRIIASGEMTAKFFNLADYRIVYAFVLIHMLNDDFDLKTKINALLSKIKQRIQLK